MSELLGRTLSGRYRIDTLIGRGGMADVYRGSDTTLDRPVAIKILTDRGDTVLRRFLREAQSMAKLNHRNIVAVYDAGQDDGFSYIIMEYIEGRTLAQIPHDELTMHVAVRYCIELLEALAYAHGTDIIHRDIKPANVMVTANGTVKVMDFGMSRRTSEMSSETHAGEIVGTIAYLAPERFLGKVADARSDLYAVGAVMYELFTGRVPFDKAGDDLVAVIFAHVNEAPASMRTINRAIPAQVDRIVLQLLEKEPDDRFPSARVVIGELQALIGGGPPPAVAPGVVATSSTPSPESQTGSPRRVGAPDGQRGPLDRPAGKATTLNVGYSNTLAGMLAARKGDYSEAIRTFNLALRAFSEIGNDVEHAKTAIKYAAMISAKNTESKRPDRHEVDEATKLLNGALSAILDRRYAKELDEGKYVLHNLQRLGLRLR